MSQDNIDFDADAHEAVVTVKCRRITSWVVFENSILYPHTDTVTDYDDMYEYIEAGTCQGEWFSVTVPDTMDMFIISISENGRNLLISANYFSRQDSVIITQKARKA